jgi:DNA gyrase/topoisomerase IV subunit B
MPTIYKISYKDSDYFAYDEKQKNKILQSNQKNTSPQISRFKGLGEMPANQLRSTTMDTDQRQLIQIHLKDGAKEEKKTEKLFDSLMGKKAENRFNFIQENANFTSNLDI